MSIRRVRAEAADPFRTWNRTAAWITCLCRRCSTAPGSTRMSRQGRAAAAAAAACPRTTRRSRGCCSLDERGAVTCHRALPALLYIVRPWHCYPTIRAEANGSAERRCRPRRLRPALRSCCWSVPAHVAQENAPCFRAEPHSAWTRAERVVCRSLLPHDQPRPSAAILCSHAKSDF